MGTVTLRSFRAARRSRTRTRMVRPNALIIGVCAMASPCHVLGRCAFRGGMSEATLSGAVDTLRMRTCGRPGGRPQLVVWRESRRLKVAMLIGPVDCNQEERARCGLAQPAELITHTSLYLQHTFRVPCPRPRVPAIFRRFAPGFERATPCSRHTRSEVSDPPAPSIQLDASSNGAALRQFSFSRTQWRSSNFTKHDPSSEAQRQPPYGERRKSQYRFLKTRKWAGLRVRMRHRSAK